MTLLEERPLGGSHITGDCGLAVFSVLFKKWPFFCLLLCYDTVPCYVLPTTVATRKLQYCELNKLFFVKLSPLGVLLQCLLLGSFVTEPDWY